MRVALAVWLLGWFAVAQAAPPPPPPGGSIRLGGIGTGWIEWRGAEGFGTTALSQNYAVPAPPLSGSFLAIWTRAQGRTTARVVGTVSPYGLPCSVKLATEHRYPFATVQCLDEDLPVVVSARLFAPVIPNDLSASSTPAIVIVFTVRNVSRAPVQAAVLASFETALGIGGGVGLAQFQDRQGITPRVHPASEGIAGVSFSGPRIEDKPVADLRMHNARGTQVLLAQSPSPDAEVTACAWNPTAPKPDWWDRFATDGSVRARQPSKEVGPDDLAGAISVRLDLQANETREIPFAIAWHSPRIYDRHGVDAVPPPAVRFADAEAVGRYVLEDRTALAALAAEWQVRLTRSIAGDAALPRLSDELEHAITSTQWTPHGDRSPAAVVIADAHSAAADGPMSWELRSQVQDALLALFPALDAADIEARIAAVLTRNLLNEPDDRLAADTLKLVARHYRMTSDRRWVETIWSRLRDAGLPALERQSVAGSLDEETMTAMLDLATVANDSELAARCAELKAGARAGTAVQRDASAWYAWSTLIGCMWNEERSVLTLRPRMSASQTRLSGPVFLPGHWAWCEWRQLPARTIADFRLDRIVPRPNSGRSPVQDAGRGPLLIRQIVLQAPRLNGRGEVRVTVRSGPTAAQAEWQEGGTVVVTLDPAVVLGAGDRITVEMQLDNGG